MYTHEKLAEMAERLCFPINLLQSGDVVTSDGEVIGTWCTDETDVIYHFTPDGEIEPTIKGPFVGPLCW